MERIRVIQFVDTSNPDEVSAFLTTTYISHSYEVETTQSVISLWEDLRKNVGIKEDIDYIAAMLATGRIMDYGFEIKDPNIYGTIISDIAKNISSRDFVSTDLQKELVAALITAAGISRSDKVETVREIVDLWVQVNDGLVLKNDLDLIAAILTVGRLMELRAKVEGFPYINDIYLSIINELSQHAEGKTVNRREIAAALITSAYIEVSPKVEKIRDMVDTWLSICDKIFVEDQWDYITMILSTGKIKDMDAQHISDIENLTFTQDKLREHIEKIVGE
jgi:hypothetical protein